jgi:zinc transport system ATP-binding protein
MPQLDCQNLTLGYEGKPVLTDLSFSVGDGDYLCIVGENGSGKSTLMRALLGLKALVSGSIAASGGFEPATVGYMPQQTAIQKDFPASVREVVRSGCLNRSGLRPFYTAAEKRLAEDNMQKLGISSIAKACYRELSGGQQQRALLARALCATRDALFLDEPAAGLDPSAAAELYGLLEDLNKGGVSIVMITHDIDAAVKYATHILHIGGGSALFFGSKADYLKTNLGPLCAACGGELE